MKKFKFIRKTGMSALYIVLFAYLLGMISCDSLQNKFDASGSFEAEETIIAAEAQGILKTFDIREGQILQAGQYIGYIDSVQLHLKKKQLEAQVTALSGRKPNIPVQLSALRTQLMTVETEKGRISNLLAGDAATPKQLDDINAQIELLKKQIDAQESVLTISRDGINKDILVLLLQIDQLEDQLEKCRLVSPISGTVLTKYVNENEMASIGKPLYKIADLSSIILRAYITGDQLSRVTLNQKVQVLTDNGMDRYKETEGVVTWISDQAEFTPKTIQTRDERANKVYAIKIRVANDGTYKIGMYGEVLFSGE